MCTVSLRDKEKIEKKLMTFAKRFVVEFILLKEKRRKRKKTFLYKEKRIDFYN